jgi:hypothetical protein
LFHIFGSNKKNKGKNEAFLPPPPTFSTLSSYLLGFLCDFFKIFFQILKGKEEINNG